MKGELNKVIANLKTDLTAARVAKPEGGTYARLYPTLKYQVGSEGVEKKVQVAWPAVPASPPSLSARSEDGYESVSSDAEDDSSKRVASFY